MKRILLILAIVAAISLGAAQLNAQGIVTLEDIAEKLRLLTREVEVQNAYTDTLATRVVDVENRLKILENPPAATPMTTITPVRSTSIPTATATPTQTPTPVPAVTVPRYELDDIFDEYGANEARAEAKYLDKIIEVNGVILDIEKKGGGFFSGKERYEITLEGRGFLSYLDCSLPLSSEDEVLRLNAGESITLRGELYFGSSTIINMRNCEIVKE
ncbi:MAG: hypothetical protein F4X14_19040 [Caldilineaceae bacterium SB0661_bin_32]|uniref:DUF5666 domain-containing protein n=1 Tax=Caldilineaceae bacterium SB0661_bin_32 TaxID=2605255 RepID=A0A6B1DBD8_9CHLR|nr:hypothetical protein [Caldilineaceae bacterium SB0661_bin_32]